MRTGFAASASAHALLIAFGLMSLGAAEPLKPETVDSIAVDLVPLSDFSNLRAGTLDSKVVETETPAIVESEKPAELARPTGNTEEDQPKPTEAPTPRPAPTVNSAPEPVPTRPPAPEPAPEPQPAPGPAPAVEPAPAPEPEPAPAAPAPELAAAPTEVAPKEVAPQPVVRTASLEEKRAAFKKQQEEAVRAAAAAAEALKKKQQQEAAAAQKQKEDEEKAREAKKKEEAAARRADAVASIINDETSRGAVTGQGGQPTLGKPTGQSATLSQSQMDALIAAMRDCFSPPMGAAEEGATARLLVTFNRDRTVAGTQILAVTGASLGDPTARAAQRAVMMCAEQQKYSMLQDDSYDQWRQVDVTFDPSLMF